jgi:hypothetical protein
LSETESKVQEPPCSLSRKGEIWWNTFEILYDTVCSQLCSSKKAN